MMKNTTTIFKKQIKDTLKNKTVLIQFVMFPLLAIIMSKAVTLDDMPANFFVNLFATMYIGMAPLTSMAAIISEEKEKGTLRALMMAEITPTQYLIGIGSYLLVMCLIGCVVFCALLEGIDNYGRCVFMLIMAIGIISSIMIGAAIGIGSKNQMSATSVTVPVMMIFSFLPMISIFNEKIAGIAKITYSEQIRILIQELGSATESSGSAYVIILLNIVLAGAIFGILYRRQGII